MPNLREKTWTTTTPATVADAQWWEDHVISDSDVQKIHSAVQTVNNKYPDDSGNVDAIPGGGTSGQVLTKISDDTNDYAWSDPSSSGHIIQDNGGTSMPYEGILQFKNASVSDDSVNGRTVVDCHGEKGDDGKSAYQYAIEGGYTGTETKFSEDLGNFQTYATVAEESAEDAEAALEEIRTTLAVPTFTVDFSTGELIYDSNLVYSFVINQSTGNLEWEVI